MDTHVILADDKAQYQKEQSDILKTLLNYRFFNVWKGIGSTNKEHGLQKATHLELYLTNQCNQKCEYCYLTKYPELYPKDKNTPEIILKNLKILYEYIILNNFSIPILDVFSGEIWHTEFGIQFLEITLEYIKKGMKISQILIPSNCYFVHSNKTLSRIQSLIDQSNNMGVPIVFSISTDGKIIDDNSRPRNSKETYNDDFYERLFTFAKVNHFLFHPMISSSNVKYWKENYEWWQQMLKYYEFERDDIMMLEVRNGDWTEESIKDYCDFMIYLIDDFCKNICNNNIELFGNIISHVRLNEDTFKLQGYVPWALSKTETFTGCTVASHLTVRVGDLAICPCHRQAYDKYLYGYFIVENNHIVDITAVNPNNAIKILMGNSLTTMPRCNMCIYNKCCLHGCHGAQIEYNNDPFFPIDNVCDLYKAKFKTIFQHLRDMGVINYLKTISDKEYNTDYVKFILELEQNDREVNINEMAKC